ncbi:MAG TPA: SLBB domain-containing protein, partial [Spirochaetales bacterium]|nr:SLBB domain-containing protein [Spirochaetales bacterium]
YDLFKASREGDLSEDPLLRPGDVVTVGKAARQVTLEGEVRRPGTYQLKEGEGVGELLGYYGDGALESAKTDLVVVTRKASAEKPESESLVFDVKGKVLPELYDGDKIRVPSREEYLPVVYVEGAVAGPEVGVKQEAQAGNAQGVVTQQYGVTRVVYRQGILVSQVVKGIKGQLDARADLKRAFITRKGESTPIGVNLEALLYAYEAKDDVVLQAEDHVVIPYGSMYVFVTGAVTKSAWVGITGLTRLSEVVKPLETEYSSERDVKVRSEDGAEAVYDLFKASREGDLSQDPYVRPGDVVTVGKANRQVTLEGEVRRPGTYQLKEGEGVGELLGYYGDGALESAKTDLVVVTRKASAEKPESESIVFDAKGKELPELYDGDKVRVPSREEYLPVVYIEGAVAGDLLSTDSSQAQSTQGQEVQTATQNQATPEQTQASRSQFIKDQSAQGAVMQGQQSTSQGSVQAPAQALMSQTGSSQSLQQVQQARYAMMRVPYRAGLTISTLLRPMKDKLLAAGDLKQAFVVSKGGASRTPIDLEKLLYGNDLSRDIVLSPEDRIVIPFGSMYVFVTGEVTKSSWVAITGLTRLRDVVSPLLTQYSSIRDIKVVSSQGSESYYDLFKADRFGDLTQDPFLMPGDTVQLLSDVNQVTIQGEVKRPGTYQLLEGEGLKELVEYYADGFTEKANTSRLALVRYTKAKDPVGEKQQFEYAANQGMTLNQYDVVTVPAMQDLLPVVWFEGAVGVGTAGPTPETSQRVPYTFYPGETISEAAIANRKLFSAISDLSNAYIIRHGKEIPISLSKFLYDYDLQGDMPLEPNDTVIVPFRQFFVTVSGAVHSPGRYPYIPNRSWNYYVGLAGGFDTDRNSGQKVTIYDVRSQKVESKGRVIQPEDNIEAASNSWLYSFTKVSGIVSTVFTTVIVILEAINLLK